MGATLPIIGDQRQNCFGFDLDPDDHIIMIEVQYSFLCVHRLEFHSLMGKSIEVGGHEDDEQHW